MQAPRPAGKLSHAQTYRLDGPHAARRGCARDGAGLAAENRQNHRAVRRRVDARHHRRLIADGLSQQYPTSVFRRRKPAGRQRQSRHRRGRQGRRPTARSSASASAARSPSTRCCSPSCPTIRSKDIAPITQLVTQPSALAVNPSLNVNTVAALMALIKAQPRQIQFRLDRQRLAVASRHGGDRHQGRHQAHARPLFELAATPSSR